MQRINPHLSKTEIRISKTQSTSLLLGATGTSSILSQRNQLTSSRNIRAHGHFGAEYHGDHSYELNPPSYTLLRMVKTPPSGGDTIFTSQTALFDKLSPTFQKTFESLHAVHSSEVGDLSKAQEST
jgi:alpha-ketoglutarate-dependent taurine dioxygenase